MLRKLLTLTFATVFALGLSSTRGIQPRNGRDSIEWPRERREFPTLQNAIDALRDGGTLSIQSGQFELFEPLIVRNKRITIQGAGSGEVLPRSRGKSDRATHLAGPRTTRVVPFSEVAGLVTYIGTGGGVLKNLKLSGFDTSVRIMAGDAAPAERSAVTVEDTCIANTGRGITSSAPRAKLVLQNVLIRDVLWNGISMSPSALGSGFHESILTSFGVIVLNTGQACVVVKNSLYTAFQNHLEDCGFNGGLPGAGGGLMAVNSGVNFIQSSVNAPNGPGIAATGGTTLIGSDSLVFLAYGAGILLFEPLYASIKSSKVWLTQPFPTGHPEAGDFGDGVLVVGQGTLWVGDTLIQDSARAGLANWGSFADLGNTKIQCAGFDLEGEPHQGNNFLFNDRGGNKCGCPTANAACVAVSAGIAPPAPVNAIE